MFGPAQCWVGHAKVDRANEHLHLLESEIGVFVGGKPYETVPDWETPTRLVMRFHIFREPPPTLAVILGDAVHNLRTALDHLVWQLVIASGARPGRHNTFPVYLSAADWAADVTQRHPRRGPGPLEGVVKGRAEIEGAQPFHGPNPRWDPLALLHGLSKTDKHRLLVASYLALPDADLLMDSRLTGALAGGRIRNHDERLEDGAEILSLDFPSPQDTEVEVQFDFTPAIAFGEQRPGLTLQRLQFLSKFVAQVIERLEQRA